MDVNDDVIKVDSPMKIVYNIESSGQSAMLTKYAHFSEQMVFEFNNYHVIQILEPKEDIITWYEQVLEYISNKEVEMIDEETDTTITEEDEEYYRSLLERSRMANTQLH